MRDADMESERPAAIVLVSGGLDSATTLAIARERGYRCHALSFRYGQRHEMELHAAGRVAESIGAVDHTIVPIDLRAFGGSALTDDAIDVPKNQAPSPNTPFPEGLSGIPVTYVPARNMIFLSFAVAHAEVIAARDIFLGVNAIDYSGYPDCRPQFIETFERVANLGTKAGAEGDRFTLHTPLIDLTKAEIIQRGIELGVDYALTLSCYDPNPAGRACGRCDSCLLRRRGFEDAGVPDPTRYVEASNVPTRA